MTDSEVLAAIHMALKYDDDTGHLIRKTSHGKGRAGEIAGTPTRNGYRSIIVAGKARLEHRIVWFMHHGEWPPLGMDVDHINGDRLDNRIGNLRLGSRSENNVNSKIPRNNTSGFKGAYFDKKKGRWASEIWVFKRKKFLGYFSSAAEAGAAYTRGARRYYGEFSRIS